ncbi:K02A2.6-like, partial [Cordylochernes scorpioides]
MEKKRKIDSECRKFKDQWNIQYFVIESSNKALCLICNESIAVLKEYNMKRHYETKHSQNYSKYTGIVRTEKFEALKRGLKSQQSLFTKVKTEQEAATRASFRVALEIAKRGKPFTDGEMIKECIIAVVEEMCPEKVNLLNTVSMSANTVARRVENIAENISSQLFNKNGHVEWFSLALDESTDVSDTAQVLIYIRGLDKSYEVHEELLDMYSIHGTTTGTDIFKGVEMAINKKNLRWKNLKCITTDGGKNMSGKDKGVVALVSKAVENDGGSKPLVLHCIIHQQSLCGKCLDMSDVLKPVISTVNFIRSFGLNHRQFRQFIAEIGETDLPYHTAVRWLSCGKVLQRFFELRAVIEIFLNEKHRPLTELQNKAWLWNHITETEFPIDFAIETLSALKINFDTRFSDFDAIANQIKIFQNPFDADIETLAPELQMEMINLQCSDIIKNKYENSSLLEFYKSLPLTQFDNLHKFARGLFSVFVAQEMALAHEAAVRNVAEIKDGKPQEEMNVMGRAVKVRRGNEKILKCFRCGYTNHRKEKCFFKDRCFKCQKLGHISRVCKNGNWRSDRNNCSIDEEAEATNGLFNINQVKDTSNMRSYMVKVRTSGRDMNMLIDSGTGKNIISEKTYIETWVKSERPRIEKDSTKLVQWNRQRLSILGKIKADVKVNKRSITMEFLVIEGPGPNLIGREAFDQIGIGFEWINYSDNVCQITEEFMDVFKEKLGQYRGPPIHIKIKTLGKPTFLRARTLPYAIRPKVEEALRKMEEQGILTPVEFTRFATPIVPVLKRDGSIRICGDYRSTVNTIVESDTFPVRAAADLQVNLAGGKVFSKLDLKDAYQQLVVDEETAELLAINTHKGLFKVNRLPFGVSCAPGIFQRRMESLIAKIPGVVVYLDDILVTGKDEMEHDLRLREVLKSIQRMGLTLKKEKCEFKKSSLIFLGCRIDAEGIHPTEEKCEAIKNFPKPENKKELQSFLGLLNFYSKFLKDRTTVLEPLHRLLNKRNCWKWKEVEDRAFREAKNLIQSDMVLTPYDARKPLVLACDASPFGVGAVLSHVEERMERPIAFASRTMSQTERRYAQIDKEALAIIFGISKFYKYLYGRDFKIITDHKPLLGIFNPNKPIPQMLSPKMMRWSLTLALYSYQIEHRPGRMNANADALSRAPHERTSKETPEPVDVFLMETNEESPLEAKEVEKSTQEDSVLGIIVEWTRIGWPAHCPAEKFRPYFNRRNELSLHRECLLWGNRVVIPPVLQGRTLEQLHETHPGIVQMKAIARSHVWWPGMDKAIENKVERCENCQLVRNNPKPSPVHPWTAPVKPWSRIHVDYAGPFHGRTFLIVVDSMSKWPEAIIMDHCTATATVRVLRSLFAVHGLPDQVVSDNGRMFVGHEFQEFLRMNGNISVTLPRALFAMRTTPHGTTGLTPAELLMGRRLTTRMNRLHPKESEDSENGKEHFQNRFKSQENVYARKYNGKGKWEPGKIKTVLGPRNYEVIMENGVTAKIHQDQLMRRVKEEVAEDVEKKEECNTERRREQMNDPNESQERLEETPGPSRPIRNRRLPEYLKDCVTNWGTSGHQRNTGGDAVSNPRRSRRTQGLPPVRSFSASPTRRIDPEDAASWNNNVFFCQPPPPSLEFFGGYSEEDPAEWLEELEFLARQQRSPEDVMLAYAE